MDNKLGSYIRNDIIVIIPVFNGKDYIDNCIKSILAGSIIPQIIVVDNASIDGSFEAVQKYRNVICKKLTKNTGFGNAVNVGMLHGIALNCQYFFLLNQDTIVENDTLINLIESYENQKWKGILSPVQLNSDGKLDNKFRAYLPADFNTRSEAIIPCHFVNAAAWLLDKNTILKIGLFDPLFFHTGEDVDYANRINYHNYKMGVRKNVFINHLRHQETNWEDKGDKEFKLSIKADYIKYLKNINKSIVWGILKSIKHAFETSRNKSKRLATKALFIVFADIFSIIKHRKISKSDGAFINLTKDK